MTEELEEEFYREARRMVEAQLKAPEAKAGQAAFRRIVEHMKLTTSDAEPVAEARKRREWIAKHFPALAAAAKPEPGWQLPKLTAEQQAEWEEKKGARLRSVEGPAQAPRRHAAPSTAPRRLVRRGLWLESGSAVMGGP